MAPELGLYKKEKFLLHTPTYVCIITVSYTHLDVYKRQILYPHTQTKNSINTFITFLHFSCLLRTFGMARYSQLTNKFNNNYLTVTELNKVL